jgi:hypothetical protein
MTVITTTSLKFGLGRHVSSQSFDDINPSLELAFASRLAYLFTLATTKLGLCAFYLQIFQDYMSRYITYVLIGFIALHTLPLELVVIFQCNPIRGAWSMIPATCINLSVLLITSAVCNIVTDFMLLALIIPRISMWFHFFLNTANLSNSV